MIEHNKFRGDDYKMASTQYLTIYFLLNFCNDELKNL